MTGKWLCEKFHKQGNADFLLEEAEKGSLGVSSSRMKPVQMMLESFRVASQGSFRLITY